MSAFFIRAHYQYGLVNLIPGGNSENKVHNINYGVSLGYFISNKHQHKK
jgi:hypothetical protein